MREVLLVAVREVVLVAVLDVVLTGRAVVCSLETVRAGAKAVVVVLVPIKRAGSAPPVFHFLGLGVPVPPPVLPPVPPLEVVLPYSFEPTS